MNVDHNISSLLLIISCKKAAARLLFCLNKMAKDFAGNFYKTAAWVKCRNEYTKSVGGLCEICMAKGLVRAGEIVHHKIFLSENNIRNPEVTLNWDNLELVCRECHAELHGKREKAKRYEISADGTVRTLQ